MNIDALKKTCTGVVAAAGDTNFTDLLHATLWNRLIPDRAPQVIVRVNDEQDIIAAILFARANKLKVVVRGGGHSWCQPTLRNGGMLIDLSNLNKVISIDPEARKAVLQPIISNRDVQQALNPLGMAYPSGHCPQVKLSGYLLGGGMSWNQGVRGHGCEGVEAIELVTSEGKLITASKTENQEYFWAARGAGSGLFGVVTRYHLKLQTLPKAMHGCSYFYPIEEAATVAAWLKRIAGSLAASVELRSHSSQESLTKPVRGVQSLSTRCALCAEFPIVGGMLGVSLRFHGPAARDMQKHSASHPTIEADSPHTVRFVRLTQSVILTLI